ncbi:hypothetical protein TNCV_2987281 [Trichonephila clavipes]|nr:hypothetical protein TNCV_2987281 [Trichonephila clavipes]
MAMVINSWPSVMSLNLVPLRIPHVDGLMLLKFVEAQSLPVREVLKFEEEECQPRCRPPHLTVVQNYEVHRQ